MGNSLGRGGRRRRVLNEEMVAASGTHAAYPSDADAEVRQLSYSEAASAENHPRVSDFVPHRCTTLWLAAAVGLAIVAALLVLDVFQPAIAAWLGMGALPVLDVSATGSLGKWFGSLVLLVTAMHLLLVYSLRRHKLNDYRGRYRIWRWAAAACFLLSINAVTGIHAVAALAATQLTGWTALRENCIWWLVPGALVFGPVAVSTIRDSWESRLSRAANLIALTLFGVAVANYIGLLPVLNDDSRMATMITPAATLTGYIWLLLAAAAYARFVILDAHGMITVRSGSVRKKPKPTTKPKKAASDSFSGSTHKSRPARAATTPNRDEQVASAEFAGGDVQKAALKATKESRSTEWIDGRQPEHAERYDDDAPDSHRRKLSKSERKRLRKLRADQRRAA